MSSSLVPQTEPNLTATPAVGGVLQRKCACGQHAINGECESCKRKKSSGMLQRATRQARLGIPNSEAVPPIVHEVLSSPGHQLQPETRNFFEPRFDHDFSRVRVHTDVRAAESARAVNAVAYTVGSNIVFAAGQYSPATSSGRQVLAHELTHVVQQENFAGAFPRELAVIDEHSADEHQAESIALEAVHFTADSNQREISSERGDKLHNIVRPPSVARTVGSGILQRKHTNIFGSALGTITGFFSSIFHGIFGFSDDALRGYLKQLNDDNEIEGDPDSDDKARAIVNKWKVDRTAFDLKAKLKRLLIQEMLDGPTTKADEDAILDLLETSGDDDVTEIFGASGVHPKQLQSDLDDENSQRRLVKFFSRRFKFGLEGAIKGQWERRPYYNLQATTGKSIDDFIAKHFSGADRQLARKILVDLRAVKKDDLDFENEDELKTEIFKRMRVSQLMKESQSTDAFAYPEEGMKEKCPGTGPDEKDVNKFARVNKEAKPFWTDVQVGGPEIYKFDLNAEGKKNAFEAVVKLFTPQGNLCDRSLIHCDYLTSIIQLRAFAESMGRDEFDKRVKSDAIRFTLNYYGAEFITAEDVPGPRLRLGHPTSAKSVSLQQMRPASEEDLVIGDHVMFWNHLAYDAITVMRPGPWRLENAVLVDKKDNGEDLFEGHGAPVLGDKTVPGTKEDMMNELMAVYNRGVEPAIDLVAQVKEGRTGADKELKEKFPQVSHSDGDKWIINELPKNSYRPKKFYELRQLTSTKDPELIGLRDEINPNAMGIVERPVESREQPLPKS